jgi:hypothetical protein
MQLVLDATNSPGIGVWTLGQHLELGRSRRNFQLPAAEISWAKAGHFVFVLVQVISWLQNRLPDAVDREHILRG